MDYWEFLIQQEGDQTWLPLETKQVEILEGRYRLAAHTSHLSAPVEIRVSQLMTAEMPPHRRVRKRRSQTNETGLIIIFPYMQLQAGYWEVNCCTTNVMDDMLGGGWQYSVQLQVLPRTEDDWDAHWPDSEKVAAEADSRDLNAASSHELNIEARQVAESLSQQMVDGLFQAVDAGLEATTASPAAASAVDSRVVSSAEANKAADKTAADVEATAEAPVYYELHLQQQAYLANHGQTLDLKGNVLSPKPAETAQPDAGHIDGDLWVQLRDPQTAHVVFETRHQQQILPHPTPFTFTLTLPEYVKDVKSRVLVGELALFDRQDPYAALASATFTITLGLTQLLDQLANTANGLKQLPEDTFEEEVSVYPGSTEPFGSSPESPSTLISPDLPLTPPKVKVLVPSLGMTLPPQIRKSEDKVADRSKDKSSQDKSLSGVSPTLPSFPTKETPRQEPISSTAEAASDAFTSDDLDSDLDSDLSSDLASNLDSDSDSNGVPPSTTLPNLDIETAQTDGEVIKAASAFMTPHSGPLQTPALFESHGIDDDDLEADLVAAVLDKTESDAPFDDEEAAIDLAPPPLFSEEAAAHDGQPMQEDQLTASFQSLNLQDRFWQKLTSLTFEDHQKAATLREGMQAAGVSETSTPEPATDPSTSEPKTTLPKPQADPNADESPADSVPALSSARPPLQAQEVVIYEETEPLMPPLQPPVQPASLSLNPQDLAELPILPTPTLEVPNRELTAGEMISIGIRLVPGSNRPYIKVWMNDLQTRTLVEEPRLLMHLTPNDRGELETYLRVKVPRGCLEIQIAAIAVDMTTLQESRKSVANRRVVPANLPSLSWDEFDV
ncbi:MAG: hypothetical protein AAF152_06285 [Cyanobacteria bacterium P01_A01_bin.114]